MKSTPSKAHLNILDMVRALATLTVMLYHYLQEWFQGSFLIVPEGLFANLQRLQIFSGHTFVGIFKDIIIFPFVYGFAAVNVFLILSGFVLTWSALKKASEKKSQENIEKKSKFHFLTFFLKKFKRILIPFYWSVLITFILLALRNFFFPALSWWPDYVLWDYLKLLFPPFLLFDIKLIQQLNGDYWFIPLILQFYIIFPLLLKLLKKVKPWKFLLVIGFITIGYRLVATYGYSLLLPFINIPFLDTAPMGVISPAQNSYYGFAFFLPRLFEFSLGMCFAMWHNENDKFLDSISTSQFFFLSFLLTLFGFSLNFYRAGWPCSDLIIGLGLFCLYVNVAKRLMKIKLIHGFLQKTSNNSYEIYLVHHNFLNLLFLPLIMALQLRNEWTFWIFMPAFFLIMLFIGGAGRLFSEKTDQLFNKIYCEK